MPILSTNNLIPVIFYHFSITIYCLLLIYSILSISHAKKSSSIYLTKKTIKITKITALRITQKSTSKWQHLQSSSFPCGSKKKESILIPAYHANFHDDLLNNRPSKIYSFPLCLSLQNPRARNYTQSQFCFHFRLFAVSNDGEKTTSRWVNQSKYEGESEWTAFIIILCLSSNIK